MPAAPLIALPWRDRAGRLSWLKLATFLCLLAPGLWLAGAYALDALGAKPITALIHATGEWAVRILLLSLAITPLRRIAHLPKLIVIRRMLGLGVLAYALIHLSLYVVDENFVLTKVASEIVLRFYLTIGFVALVGLIVLGTTSTDGMVRRLGPSWHRLHKAVYAIAALALLHHFIQAKIDVSNAVFATGAFGLLMGWRVMHHYGVPTRPLPLAALAVAVWGLTVGIEAAWYGLATNVPAALVLEANLDFSYVVRPAWWVLALGLTLPVLNLVRTWSTSRGRDAGTRPTLGQRVPARAVPAQ